MSKNLTRKGLAFGALVALGSTVIAGVPAQAAGELNVVPSAGTSYNVLFGEVFNLKTTFAPGYTPSSYAQLLYQIKTDANSTVEYGVGVAAVASPATSVAVSTTAVSGATGSASSTSVNYLGLEATASTAATTSVEVTAFVDANNDGAFTAGEWNTVRTVTFKKAADVTPTVTLTAPATGDTSVKATVNWGDLNVDQSANEVVKFTVGSQFTAANGTFDSTTNVWSKSATGLTAAEAVSAQAYIGSTALGTAVSSTAAARSISGLIANVSAGNDAIATAQTTANLTNTAARVRTNGAFVATVKALDTATTPVAKSSVAVTATVSVTGATLAASPEVSVTVAGTKYTSASTLAAATFPVTTAADGTASLAVSTAGFAAGNSVTVTFTAQNLSSAVVATAEATAFTTADADKSGSLYRSIAEGGSSTIDYVVKDQFGVAITGAARLEITIGYTTAEVKRVNLVNGAASVTVADTTASTADPISVSAQLQTQDAASLNWSNASGVAALVHSVDVAAAAAAFSTAPVSATVARSTAHTFTGTVNNGGSAVTVTASGVTFTYNSVDYTDKVTFFTGSNGSFSLAAKSNVSGAKTVTFTVGSATATAVLTVSAPTGAQGTKVSFTTPPTTIEPGKTISVVGKLVDEYGNAVSTATPAGSTFSVTYAGPGFVIGSLPTATDANGEFKVQVLTGANDSGSAVFTVTYDADGTGTASAAITATATVAVAAPAAPEVKTTIVGVTKAIRVRVENAKGEEVEVVVNGRTVAVATAGTNSKLWVLKSTKGKKSVKVYVDGDLVAVKTVTVK
jgi:intracellular sulfur oxidation DsrE/DsrF family protein